MKLVYRILAILPTLAVGLTIFLLVGISYDIRKTLFLIIPMIWAFVIVLHEYENTVKDVQDLFKKLHT